MKPISCASPLNRLRLPLLLATIALFLSAVAAPGRIAADTTVIEKVSIVDVISGELLKDMTIVVVDGKIEAVGSAAEISAPEGSNRIDASGLYAIPGLWDMHIHWYDINSMALFPLNGVTGVRVMWGSPMHHGWREQFSSGGKLGPRMMIASTIIDGPNPIWPGSIVAENAESGRKAVQKAIELKSDFAKVYSLLSRDAYFAIAAEAKKHSLPFDGHVPSMVSAREASNAGHRCMEHLYEVILACSSDEEVLRKLRAEAVGETGAVRDLFANRELSNRIARRALKTFDQAKANELFELFRENQTWQCPTLTVLRNLAYITDESVQNNPNLKYIPASMASFIAPKGDRFQRSEDAMEFGRVQFKKNLAILADMQSAGVPILAGTDCLNPYCLPGFSLHEELELMVEAGLTPIEALRAATINPARFQNKSEELGSIETGKAADIVLLRADPLKNISNTNEIEHVFVQGRHLDRAQLDAKLGELERAD